MHCFFQGWEGGLLGMGDSQVIKCLHKLSQSLTVYIYKFIKYNLTSCWYYFYIPNTSICLRAASCLRSLDWTSCRASIISIVTVQLRIHVTIHFTLILIQIYSVYCHLKQYIFDTCSVNPMNLISCLNMAKQSSTYFKEIVQFFLLKLYTQ